MSRNAFRRAKGTITASHAALTNALRYKPIGSELGDTNHVSFSLNNDYNEFIELISHVNGTDGDTNVLELYAQRDINDDYTHVATLTYTVGTMIYHGGTRLYHDTLDVTEVDESFEVVASLSAANDMAKCWMDTNGYKNFLLVASTLGSTDTIVEYASVNRYSIPVTA